MLVSCTTQNAIHQLAFVAVTLVSHLKPIHCSMRQNWFRHTFLPMTCWLLHSGFFSRLTTLRSHHFVRFHKKIHATLRASPRLHRFTTPNSLNRLPHNSFLFQTMLALDLTLRVRKLIIGCEMSFTSTQIPLLRKRFPIEIAKKSKETEKVSFFLSVMRSEC